MLYRVLVKMYPIGQTYARVEETECAVLDRMAGSAAKVFGQVIGVKPKEKEGCKTPIAEHMRDKIKYLPKDKNLEKGRPIVPYRKHGLRRVLKAAARALLYVVEKLEASGQLETFTLKTCTDLGKSLIQINDSVRKMEDGDGRSRALVMSMNDVKSMFTALPRDEIRKAIESLFELA